MTRARNYEGISSLNSAWVDMLRANCLTLVERPGVARAISVSRGFPHGMEDERDAVIVLAQRMAEEYGLASEVEVRGYFLTIRFTRHEEEPGTVESPRGSSLFERLLAVLHRGQSIEQETDVIEDRADSRIEVRS